MFFENFSDIYKIFKITGFFFISDICVTELDFALIYARGTGSRLYHLLGDGRVGWDPKQPSLQAPRVDFGAPPWEF